MLTVSKYVIWFNTLKLVDVFYKSIINIFTVLTVSTVMLIYKYTKFSTFMS